MPIIVIATDTMKALLITICTTITIGGCATPRNDHLKQVEIENTIPTCSSPKECEMKWAAVRRWVLSNSGYNIRILTNDYLETFNSVGGSPKLAMRVAKEPLGGERYRFTAAIWCGNLFGCVPDATDSLLRFNREVSSGTY